METTTSSNTSETSDTDSDADMERPSTKLSRLRDSLKQEGAFLRIPIKHYIKINSANQNKINNFISDIIFAVIEATKCDMSPHDAVLILNSVLSELQYCKRVLEELVFNQRLQHRRFMARLIHIDSADLENLSQWNKIRLNRILVGYMLCMSYRDTAMKLTETSNIQELVEIQEFDEVRTVISSLQNKEVAPALAWCADNKSELKKNKSKLELDLRLQEFVELVRADNYLHAIKYAQKYLAPWGKTHMNDLKRVLVTLIFRSSNQHATCKVLFDPKQWDYLVNQFKQEFYKLYGMTSEPLLSIYLQAGLCALKTPFGYEDDCSKEDPLSQESFRKLAEPLPFSKQYPIFTNYVNGEQMGPKQICHFT